MCDDLMPFNVACVPVDISEATVARMGKQDDAEDRPTHTGDLVPVDIPEVMPPGVAAGATVAKLEPLGESGAVDDVKPALTSASSGLCVDTGGSLRIDPEDSAKPALTSAGTALCVDTGGSLRIDPIVVVKPALTSASEALCVNTGGSLRIDPMEDARPALTSASRALCVNPGGSLRIDPCCEEEPTWASREKNCPSASRPTSSSQHGQCCADTGGGAGATAAHGPEGEGHGGPRTAAKKRMTKQQRKRWRQSASGDAAPASADSVDIAGLLDLCAVTLDKLATLRANGGGGGMSAHDAALAESELENIVAVLVNISGSIPRAAVEHMQTALRERICPLVEERLGVSSASSSASSGGGGSVNRRREGINAATAAAACEWAWHANGHRGAGEVRGGHRLSAI
jgi:hypothetical protein